MTISRTILGSVLGFILLLPAGGCGYGEVSPTAYEYSKALYSITNRKAEEKLAEVEEQITAAAATGELTDREAKWLGDIIDQAESGEWQAANQACRMLMQDQVRSK